MQVNRVVEQNKQMLGESLRGMLMSESQEE